MNNLSVTLSATLFYFISSSCSAPRYIPHAEEIDINEYGSYIKVDTENNNNLDGELIALDSLNLYILTVSRKIKHVTKVPLAEVGSIRLRYAQPKNYSWAIPVYSAATIAHGYLLSFTAPINILVTTIVSISGANAFQYADKDLTYDELKMFARFPQGIPPGIDISEIH